MSTQRKYGLVGDSEKKSDTECVSRAFFSAGRSDGSITVVCGKRGA